jgi:hypothetical protein
MSRVLAYRTLVGQIPMQAHTCPKCQHACYTFQSLAAGQTAVCEHCWATEAVHDDGAR